MKKLTRIAFTAGLLFMNLVAMTSVSHALTTSVQKETGQKESVRTEIIKDFVADDIIQLKNLTITSISEVGLPSTVTAETSGGVVCERFSSEQSNIAMPCSVDLGFSYSIQVTTGTILLYNTRTRAPFSAFEVGDVINVYGFRDTDHNTLQALIMRDMSKPATAREVQLEQMTVLKGPSSATPPARLLVGFRPNGCYDFSGIRGLKRIIPCPLRSTADENDKEVKTQLQRYPEFVGRHYVVHVTERTKVIGPERTPFPLDSILAGYKVNVYGTVQGNAGVIEASILRVVERPPDAPHEPKPTEKPNRALISISVDTDEETYDEGEPITISVTAHNKSKVDRTLEFTGGCEANYSIYKKNNYGKEEVVYNDFSVRLCAQVLTSMVISAGDSHTWTFVHNKEVYELDPGRYVVKGEVSSYGPARTDFAVR